MASISSGSSDDGDTSFTTTDVLLGYASKEPTDDPFSQLGGHPAWPDTSSPPSALLAKCKVCNRLLTLLLQLNGDLPERFPDHERRLYIFACRSKTCKKKTGSIRAIRGIKLSQSTSKQQHAEDNGPPAARVPEQSKPPPMLGDSIFGSKSPSATSSNANPFSTSSASTPGSSPFANTTSTNPFADLASKPAQRPDDTSLPTTFAQKVRLSSPPPSQSSSTTLKTTPHEPWPSQSQLPPPYPSYHLDADYEAIDNTFPDDPRPSRTLDIEEDTATGGGGGGGGGKDEPYESTLDRTFQKFATRLSHNPLQVLRYEYGGSPLLYSKTDSVGKLFTTASGGPGRIPRCENCGKGRVFELQLVPQAIAELEVEETGLEGMEWGTVIVGVCGEDCGQRGIEGGRWGWLEEWVGVQWEEAGGGRK